MPDRLSLMDVARRSSTITHRPFAISHQPSAMTARARVGASVLLAVLTSALVSPLGAQMRVVPLDDEHGHVALGLALRQRLHTGFFLHRTADPDGEHNG